MEEDERMPTSDVVGVDQRVSLTCDVVGIHWQVLLVFYSYL